VTLNKPINEIITNVEFSSPENDSESEDELISYVLKLATSCDESPTYEAVMRGLL
jgi:hypothetical protein